MCKLQKYFFKGILDDFKNNNFYINVFFRKICYNKNIIKDINEKNKQ